MRLLFNQWSTAGKRTGVGHVARQLALHIAEKPSIELTAFPSDRYLAWDSHLRAVTKQVDVWRQSWKRSGRGTHAFAPLGFLRILARRSLQAHRRFYDRVHREAFFGGQHDLYHEPNFLPFESSLPTVTTLHDLSVLLHPEWHPSERIRSYEENFPRTLEQSTHFVTVSEFTRKQMIRYLCVPPHRVTAIPNAPRSEFRPLPEAEVDAVRQALKLPARYLLYVGTIEPRKNTLRLMQAYVSLPAAVRRDCPLLLAGQWGWNIARERAYYESVGRHHGVRCLGYVPDKHLPALFNGARALVYPSVYEGFGLPPLEMLACGGAVIASRIDPIEEVTGDQAHLVDPHDADGWREALHRIIRDDDWRAELRRGAVRVAGRFTWRRAADEHAEVYRRVLQRDALPFVAPKAAPLRRAA
jgi:alpha-1,3-rhamnosyl/mannosyltransferase